MTDTLVVTRFTKLFDSVLGRLSYQGKHLAFTLEDVEGKGGIPAGCYELLLTFSPKFKTILPLIEVPGRSGIRIHAGNTKEDVTGCTIVGQSIWLQEDNARLMDSRKALEPLMGFLRLNQEVKNIVYLNPLF